MTYQKLLLKKVYRNRLNLVPLLLMMIFLLVIYSGNRIRTYHHIQDPTYSGEKELEVVRQNILMFQTELDNLDESDPLYEMIQKELQDAQQKESALQQRLEAVERKDWKQYYESDLVLTKIQQEAISRHGEFHGFSEHMEVLRLDQEYAEYMMKNNLSYDGRFSASQGFSYMIQVINDYLPLLFTILLIFIISKLYCSSFIEDIDMHSLIPIHGVKRQGIRLLVGMIIGISIIFLIGFISIIYGWIGNTLGNINSPVLSYSLQGAVHYISFSSMFLKLLILFSLSILFIVQLVSIISTFARKHILCLMITLVIIIGGMWVVKNIVPIYSIAHILPTTYLDSLKVISGELSFITHNSSVHFLNGVIVLAVSNFLLFIVFYYLMKFRMKGVRSI